MEYLTNIINKNTYSVGCSKQVLDNIMSEHTYFITVTIKPSFYKYTSITQLELLYHVLQSKTGDNVIIVPEHTSAGNIHFHLVKRFRDECDKIRTLNLLRSCKKFGFIHIKTDEINHVSKLERALAYLLKNLSDTKRILGNNLSAFLIYMN